MRLHRIGMIALLPLGMCACSQGDPPARTVVTGLMDATEIDVASKVPGRVKEAFVREGQPVEAGAKQLAMAKKTYDRVVALRATGAVADAQLDEADAKLKLAQDQLDMAQSRYTMVMRGARAEEIDALAALVEQARGNLAEVRSYERETTQTAPIAGEVTRLVLHPGELAATGYPIVTLVDLNDIWATFAVREDALQHVGKGDTVEVQVPALGRSIPMTIDSIAAMGDYATWKATSEKNSFDLKSFEVKARPAGKIEGLRPGMTVRWAME